ncbi:hypothetical protein GCM10012287_29480 [Streptomyces daqingensis]|uniref:Uncharacterized protein n=1 Tax=Streptomyces daqingensis TaxID=1472640 RepID=A0ABQ2MD66_9ACTN|nr:hypothetical protein GCM10012287_29480 [Streptomyces daqingensis]
MRQLFTSWIAASPEPLTDLMTTEAVFSVRAGASGLWFPSPPPVPPSVPEPPPALPFAPSPCEPLSVAPEFAGAEAEAGLPEGSSAPVPQDRSR